MPPSWPLKLCSVVKVQPWVPGFNSKMVPCLSSPPAPVTPYRLPFASNVSPLKSPPGTVCRILNLGLAAAVPVKEATSARVAKDRRRMGDRFRSMANYLVAERDRGGRSKPFTDRNYTTISIQNCFARTPVRLTS